MITEIEIGGYRLLDEFKADFTPLTVVIGANAVGKSTLIDCLQLIGECCEVPLNTAMGWHYGAASILTSGKADKDNELSWKVSFRIPDATCDLTLNYGETLVYDVVLEADRNGQMQPRSEILSTQVPRGGTTEPIKFLESTQYGRRIFDVGEDQLIPFDETGSTPDVVRELNGSEFESRQKSIQSEQQEAALLLSQIRFFNEFPVPARVRENFAKMAFYPGFDVSASSALRTKPAEIKPVATLSTNGDNLATVVHEIRNGFGYKSANDEMKDFLRAAYPSFEDFGCETTRGAPSQTVFWISEKGMRQPMYPWDLSDGVLRFLCLAATLLNPTFPPLIAIDQPELGLHPAVLPVVAEMIKTAAERTQVLVTTHSPDLLNCFDISEVAVMARHEDDAKVVWYRPANRNTLVEMLMNVTDESLGDLHRSGELEAFA